MFIFPLGFGKRLPVLPFILLLLTAVIFAFSAFQMSSFKALKKEMAQEIDARTTVLRLRVVRDVCLAKGNPEALCRWFMKECIARLRKQKDAAPDQLDLAERELAAGDDEPAPKNLLQGGVTPNFKAFTDTIKTVLAKPEKVTDKQIRALASYRDLMAQFEGLKKMTALKAREHGYLHAQNLNLHSLITAQFQHAGWLHLLGNLLIFVIFGLAVEARMGAGVFALIFVASGYIGLFTELLVNTPPGFLLGASANVSGIVGAFAVLYHKQRMRVWLSYLFMYNRVLYLPVPLVVIVSFVARDLTGALSANDGVAQVAHLAGFATGAAIAYWFRLNHPLSDSFLYPQETELLHDLKDSTEWQKVEPAYSQIMRWNPNNYLAMFRGIKLALASDANLRAGGIFFVKTYLSSLLALLSRTGRWTDLVKVLHAVPANMPLAELITRWSYRSGLDLAAHALKDGDWLVAIRVYDWILQKNTNPAYRRAIAESLYHLGDHLRRNDRGFEQQIHQLSLGRTTMKLLMPELAGAARRA